MKLLLSDFAFVSFHDSPVRAVEEKPGHIRISLDFAYLRPPLESAQGKRWELSGCLLECLHVSRSEKEEWDDTCAPKAHSAPAYPIEEVQHEEVVDGCLALSGFTRTKNWGVWRIAAREFELTWKSQKEANQTPEPTAPSGRGSS